MLRVLIREKNEQNLLSINRKMMRGLFMNFMWRVGVLRGPRTAFSLLSNRCAIFLVFTSSLLLSLRVLRFPS